MIFVLAGEVIPESQRQGNTGWATVGAVVGFTIIMILDVASG
jgi:ZIP family zinc transporter